MKMMLKCKTKAKQLPHQRDNKLPPNSKIIRTCRRRESSSIAKKKNSKPTKTSRAHHRRDKEAFKPEEVEVTPSSRRARPRK